MNNPLSLTHPPGGYTAGHDRDTWESLSEEEKVECSALWSQFIKTYCAAMEKYGVASPDAIERQGDLYVWSASPDGSIPGIAARSRKVLEAMLEDGGINYER
jgi:hypothetical protein